MKTIKNITLTIAALSLVTLFTVTTVSAEPTWVKGEKSNVCFFQSNPVEVDARYDRK